MGLFVNSCREIWDAVTERPRRNRQIADMERRWLDMTRDGYTITQVVAGVPVKWFCYCPRNVWRWSASERMAEIFPDRSAAERAAANCSVYYKSSYQIIKRN
jgi:hypothetical protein